MRAKGASEATDSLMMSYRDNNPDNLTITFTIAVR
jgi:hypothetical protein